MDCDTARDLIAYRRPGGPSDLAPEDTAALDQHLAGCPTCAAVVQRRDGFDAAVAAAMKSVPVPAGLREKLLKQVADRRAARFRRNALSGVAAAAAVLIAVFLAYGVRRATQPVFDPEGFAVQQDRAAEGPDQAVADWLTQNGLPAELPESFNFRYYAFHGKVPVFGRDVPVIVFQRRQPGQSQPDTLKLYVIRGDQFRFDGLRDVAGSLFTTAVVKDDRDGSGLVYLALYNTPDWRQFLSPAPQQN